MKKQWLFLLLSCVCGLTSWAQTAPDTTKSWKIGGGVGFDFAQLLLVNPRVGAGENRIGLAGNSSFYANYSKGRLTWKNAANVNLGVQKLGRGNARPFQKSIDEVRFTSTFLYNLTKEDPFAYALDALFLTSAIPTYEGNFLTYQNTARTFPISRFLAPATVVVSPGIAYKPDAHLSVLLSPASLKMTIVADDSIAQLANTAKTASLQGNPLGRFTSEEAFRREWKVRPAGKIDDSTYYAKTFMQLGATFKATYQNKFLKDAAGKARLGVNTSLTLYSNYLRQPQNIDVEWITTTDLYIIKGLSITLITNLFYDHDVLVLVNRDGDINTGVNGYESTGRRVSFTQSLLLKYNFLF